mmetsp:Transcript_12191/g.19316  ORF Transcript_12191/g.19316 Transcript_12191/m.19316 type:complete len:86 (+) Transcript_12191:853-1110(+)
MRRAAEETTHFQEIINVLHTNKENSSDQDNTVLQHTACVVVYCSVSACPAHQDSTAMYCNTLQHTATYSNTPQNTTTHCSALSFL